jgi:hypothetical protein
MHINIERASLSPIVQHCPVIRSIAAYATWTKDFVSQFWPARSKTECIQCTVIMWEIAEWTCTA